MKIIGIILLSILALILAALLIAVIRTLLLPAKVCGDVPPADPVRTEAYAEKLSRLVQYETVSRRGAPDPEKFRGFHTLLAELYPTVFSRLEKIEIDGNLMMRWQGKDPNLKPIMLISHQDVVPAEGSWTYPPFSGTIADGKVWGRGSADIKCGIMAFYQAAEELLTEGYEPVCDIYLGSSCTEEIGGDGAPKMAAWLTEHGIRLFMLCDEGGAIVRDPINGVRGSFASIGIFEKGYGDLRFTARSKGGHSSKPPKNTPIVRLARFEAAVEKHDPLKSAFSPAVEQMFACLAPYCTNFALKTVMHNLWLFKPLLKKVLPFISPEAAAMLKTTIAFTMQKGSDGANVLPQEAWVNANLRYIPHQGLEESNAVLTRLAEKYGLTAEFMGGNEPSRSLELDGEAYRITCDTIGKVFPGIGIMPYVVIGGTDSRFFDAAAESCVRFSPVLYGQEQLDGMHGIDENLNAASLPPAVDYFKEIIKAQEGRR